MQGWGQSATAAAQAAIYGEFFACTAESVADGPQVLRLDGEFSAYALRSVRKALHELHLEADARLLVDLTDVTFIDAAALELLALQHRALTEQGGGLSVICPNIDLRKTFLITGLDHEFAVHTSLETALSR